MIIILNSLKSGTIRHWKFEWKQSENFSFMLFVINLLSLDSVWITCAMISQIHSFEAGITDLTPGSNEWLKSTTTL